MESNATRWCFYRCPPTSQGCVTIQIENKPLTLAAGYRTANDIHLYNRDFYSFFKCLLMIRYFNIDYGDTQSYMKGLRLKDNLINLKFSKDAPFNQMMCLRNDEIYYLIESKSQEQILTNKIKILKHPSIDEFVYKLDVKYIYDFLIDYLKQSNIGIFRYVISEIIDELKELYKQRDNSTTYKNFFLDISPNIGDFFLFHSIIRYVVNEECTTVT